MTVPSPVTVGENGLKDSSTPVSALIFFSLFHPSILSSLPVYSNEVNQSAFFLHTLFFYPCTFHLVSSSSFPPPSCLSVLYLCPVMQWTTNLSSPFFLLLCLSATSFIFTLHVLFSFLPSLLLLHYSALSPYFLPSASVWPVMQLTTTTTASR